MTVTEFITTPAVRRINPVVSRPMPADGVRHELSWRGQYQDAGFPLGVDDLCAVFITMRHPLAVAWMPGQMPDSASQFDGFKLVCCPDMINLEIRKDWRLACGSARHGMFRLPQDMYLDDLVVPVVSRRELLSGLIGFAVTLELERYWGPLSDAMLAGVTRRLWRAGFERKHIILSVVHLLYCAGERPVEVTKASRIFEESKEDGRFDRMALVDAVGDRMLRRVDRLIRFFVKKSVHQGHEMGLYMPYYL